MMNLDDFEGHTPAPWKWSKEECEHEWEFRFEGANVLSCKNCGWFKEEKE